MSSEIKPSKNNRKKVEKNVIVLVFEEKLFSGSTNKEYFIKDNKKLDVNSEKSRNCFFLQLFNNFSALLIYKTNVLDLFFYQFKSKNSINCFSKIKKIVLDTL